MASSFDCFEKEFPALTKLGKLAESYCYSDPNGALYKIRKIGETITTLIYEYDSLPIPTGNVSDIPQASRINALYDSRIINGLLAKSFTRLRKIGNEAVHEDLDSSVLKKNRAKEVVQTGLDQISLLKKSILARTFRGEL